MKKKRSLLVALKGFLVGSSMLVPGVSGGTMALILGIYNDLIHAVNAFFKEFKKSILLLGVFCLGAGLGFLSFARAIDAALTNFPNPTKYFFIGTILGGLPLLFRESKVDKTKKSDVILALLCFAAGLAIIIGINKIPRGLFTFNGDLSLSSILLQLAAGIIIAVALVLPGISTSNMLYVLGIYEFFLAALKNPLDNLGFFASLGIFTVIGVFLTTGILEFCMTRFPKQTYFIIIGFVAGSVKMIEPGIPHGWEIPVCVVLCVLGFIAILLLSRLSGTAGETDGDAVTEPAKS